MPTNSFTLKTTKEQASLVGKYKQMNQISEDVIKELNEWHKLQFKQNKQLQKAYNIVYAQTYDIYANAKYAGISGVVGDIERDAFNALHESIFQNNPLGLDAILSGSNVLKNAGVFKNGILDANNKEFRDAVTRALVQANIVGGEKGQAAMQQWIDTMIYYNKMLSQGSPALRKYVESLGTTSEKLSLLNKDSSKLAVAYKQAVKERNVNAIDTIGSALIENAMNRYNLIKAATAIKAVPVSEQVSLGSKEAYSMIYKQSTEQNAQNKMYNNVGSINNYVKSIERMVTRDRTKAVSSSKQSTLNLVTVN
jgi:hypothetical protein